MSGAGMLRAAWLAAGWLQVVLVVYLSLTPNPPQPSVAYGDKIGHFIAYLVMMAWFAELYAGRRRWGYALFLIGLGLVLELLQGLTDYRSLEFWDLASDTLGVLCACWIYRQGIEGIRPRLERRLWGSTPSYPEVPR